jgi:hypothetical protein
MNEVGINTIEDEDVCTVPDQTHRWQLSIGES